MQRLMNPIPSEKRFKTISIKGWYCKNGDFHFFLPQYAISSCRVGAIACQSLSSLKNKWTEKIDRFYSLKI